MVKYNQIIIDGIKLPYTISEYGDILSLNYNNTKQQKYLKHQIDKDGYHAIGLKINKKTHRFRISRLVAMTFIPIPERYITNGYGMSELEVNHIDGNKDNNHVSNLEWCTSKENIQHAEKNNLRHHKTCENHPMAKIDRETAHKICNLLEQNKLTISEIAEKLNVKFHTVYEIAKEDAWKEVSKLYKIKKYNVKPNHRKNCVLRVHDDDTVLQICKLLQDGDMTMKEIAEYVGVVPSYIEHIKYRKIHQELSKDFTFKTRTMKRK